MRYQVTHITNYLYNDTVAISQNIAHLRPRKCDRQSWLRTDLAIDPWPAVLSERFDFFGNPLTFFAVQEAHRSLKVIASGEVEVKESTAFVPQDTPPWESVRSSIRSTQASAGISMLEFVFESPYIKSTPALLEYTTLSFPAGRPIGEAILDLCHRIYADFKFDAKATTITTPLQDVLMMRRGVCQDFAHLMIGCCRVMGLAARYVSGYLLTMPRAGRPRLVGGDASHAWLSVYCPGAGWIDVDPTNDQLVSDKHITLAWGRDFGDVSPLQGVILGGRRHNLSISVDVSPMPA